MWCAPRRGNREGLVLRGLARVALCCTRSQNREAAHRAYGTSDCDFAGPSPPQVEGGVGGGCGAHDKLRVPTEPRRGQKLKHHANKTKDKTTAKRGTCGREQSAQAPQQPHGHNTPSKVQHKIAVGATRGGWGKGARGKPRGRPIDIHKHHDIGCAREMKGAGVGKTRKRDAHTRKLCTYPSPYQTRQRV